MGWNEKLEAIIEDIEQHLQVKEDAIDVENITRIAGCSYSFFQKVFSYMNGLSLAEYVRYRKLSLAGYDLKSTKDRVVDISLRYGYDSPTSFTKAFQQFHGVTPTQARNQATTLRVFPRMHVAKQQHYTWNLIQEEELRLIGKRTTLPISTLQTDILKFWSDCQRDGTYATLISLDQSAQKGLFGIFLNTSYEQGILEYAIMVQSKECLPEGFVETILPSVTWAKFDCIGPIPSSIQDGWRFLNNEWIQTYPFQHEDCPELEWYSDGNTFLEDYFAQIWIPIKEAIKE